MRGKCTPETGAELKRVLAKARAEATADLASRKKVVKSLGGFGVTTKGEKAAKEKALKRKANK